MFLVADVVGPGLGFTGVVVGAVLVAVLGWLGERRSWRRAQRLDAYSAFLDAAFEVIRDLEEWHIFETDAAEMRRNFDRGVKMLRAMSRIRLVGSREVVAASIIASNLLHGDVYDILLSPERISQVWKLRNLQEAREVIQFTRALGQFALAARKDLGQPRRGFPQGVDVAI